MPLPRLQLFEFNDLPIVPAPIRDSVVESLSRVLDWSGMVAAYAAPFERFLTAAGTRQVLDLGSGAGGPAALLVDALRAAGAAPVHFQLTDLHPHPESWARVLVGREASLTYVAEPVDATAIPAPLAAGRVRTILNVLHHFPPALAQAVLLDAVQTGEGVFVAEGFERNPLRYLPMWPTGIPAMLLNPVLSPRDNVAKALLTWFTPTAALVGLWDGVVSTLRVYTEAELRAMVAPAGDNFEWTYATYDYGVGGRGYNFSGVRRS